MVASDVVANRAKSLSIVEVAVTRIPTAVEVGLIANVDSNDQLDPDPAVAVASSPQVNLPVLAL